MSTDTLWVYTVSYTVHGWNYAVREQRAATMTSGAATGAATIRQPVRQQVPRLVRRLVRRQYGNRCGNRYLV